MFKNLAVLTLTMLLTACANNPIVTSAGKAEQSTMEVLYEYANQLMTANEPYATIRIYPFVPNFGYGSLDNRPVHIYQVGENPINLPKNQTFGTQYRLITPFLELKVPVGEQTVIFGYHAQRLYQFTMNFKEGKRYIIKPDFVAKDWQVYEYEQDFRFAANAKEGMILKDVIVPQVVPLTPKAN